jgi:glycosyltransferase involved in cell wall biosynthesis
MRILLAGDYASDPRLGSTKVLFKLRDELVALGHECDLLLAHDIGSRPRHRTLRWAFAPLLAARAVAKRVRAHGAYDVIDVASAEGFVIAKRRGFTGAAATAVVSRSNGLEHLNYKRMLADHDAGIQAKPWPRRIAFPALRLPQVAGALRAAERAIVLNPADRDFIIAHGWKQPDEVDLVPHGVSDEFMRAGATLHARGSGLLFCGSWDTVKGVDYLIAAFAEIARRMDSARLTVLGPGVPAEAVLERFPEALRQRVRVLPRVDEAEVMEHYRAHDLLLVPSTYEGFGMVIIEAMSQQLPVLSTPVGCAPIVIENGVNGGIVPARDAHALADAACALLADGAARTRMGGLARQAVLRMTWRRTAEHTLRSYHAAIEARRRILRDDT